MNKVIIRIALVIFALALLLSSCNDEVNLNTGILANESIVSSIRQEIEDKENSLLAAEGDVFWSPSGKLWHATHKCSYLANSKTIYHGSIEEARLEGKERGCTRCGAGHSEASDAIYAELEKNEISDGDVFFNREAVEWHADKACSMLSKEEAIYHAPKSKAEQLGKILPCEKCSK